MPWWTCHCGSRPDGAEGSRWLSTWSWHHLLLWRSDYEGLPTPWGSLEAKRQIIQNKPVTFISVLSHFGWRTLTYWSATERRHCFENVPLAGEGAAVVTSNDVQYDLSPSLSWCWVNKEEREMLPQGNCGICAWFMMWNLTPHWDFLLSVPRANVFSCLHHNTLDQWNWRQAYMSLTTTFNRQWNFFYFEVCCLVWFYCLKSIRKMNWTALS